MHGSKTRESYTKGEKAIGGQERAGDRGFPAGIPAPALPPVQGGFQNPHQREWI